MSNSIILASASPRRKQLLGMLYDSIRIEPSGIAEPEPESETPAAYAEKLSGLKAYDVAAKFPHSVVIGSDTIVVLDERILGKPADSADAINMLQNLSGRSHQVISAVTLVEFNEKQKPVREKTFHERTAVSFAQLSTQEIERYVQSGSPMDKAGSYGIQDDLGCLFVSHIDGDYYTVVGFPLHRFYTEMKHFAPELLPGNFRITG